MGDNYITLKTKENQDNISVIEVQLPNPYLNINNPEKNRTIQYRIKSKFKSPFADYINHSLTNDTFNIKDKLKRNNNKYKISSEFNDNIHFTKTHENIDKK